MAEPQTVAKAGIEVVLVGREGASEKLKQTVKDMNKVSTVKVDMDLAGVEKSLNEMRGMVTKMANSFDNSFKFSGLQKSLDDSIKKFHDFTNEVKKDGKIRVDVDGFKDLQETTNEISTIFKQLSNNKIDISAFTELKNVVNEINTSLLTMIDEMGFRKVRPSKVVNAEIDNLEKLKKQIDTTNDAATKLDLEKKFSWKGNAKDSDELNRIARSILLNGDASKVASEKVEEFKRQLQEFIKVGGQVSEIHIDGRKSNNTLQDVIEKLSTTKQSGNELLKILASAEKKADDAGYFGASSLFGDLSYDVQDGKELVQVIEDVKNGLKEARENAGIEGISKKELESYELLLQQLNELSNVPSDTFKLDLITKEQEIDRLTNKIKILNDELEKAQARENRDMKVGLDEASIEALRGLAKIEIKDGATLGIDSESLNLIVDAIEKIVIAIEKVATILDDGIDINKINAPIETVKSNAEEASTALEKLADGTEEIEKKADAMEHLAEAEKKIADNAELSLSTSNKNNVLSVEGQAQTQQEVTTAIEKSVEAENELKNKIAETESYLKEQQESLERYNKLTNGGNKYENKTTAIKALKTFDQKLREQFNSSGQYDMTTVLAYKNILDSVKEYGGSDKNYKDYASNSALGDYEHYLQIAKDIASGIEKSITSTTDKINILKSELSTIQSNETTISNPDQTAQLERENTAIEENTAKLKENTQAHEENNNASHIGGNDPIARAMEEEGQTVDKIASEEELALQRLQSALIETARTVDIKTQAFRDEQQTVDGVVQEEITRLEVLSGTILSLASDLEKFTNIPVNIKVEDNGLSEENLDRIKNSLTTIKEQIGDSIILDVKFDEQSLIDFTSKSDNLVTNLDKIVADLKGIVVEINAIDPDILKNLGKATGSKPNVNGNQPKNTGLKDVNISSQEVADIQNRIKREKDFRDVLGDELDIIKQIRSVNGKQYESYRVTGKNGNSITFGRSTKGKNGKWSYNPLNASVSGSDDYTASQASDRLNAQVHKSAGADWRKNVIAEVKTIQTLENQISELNTKTNKNQLAELQRQLTAHQNNLKALEKESSTYQDVVDMTKLAVQKDNERNKLIEKQAQKSTKAFDTEMKAKQDQKAKDQKINQEEYNKLLSETLNKYEAMYKLREKMNSEQDLYKKANLKAEVDEAEKAYNSAYGKLSKRKSYSGLFDKSEYEKQRDAIANKYTTRIDNNQKSDIYKEQQNALEWLIKNEQNYQNLIAKRDSTATDEDGNKILKYTADNIQAEEKLSKQIEEKKAIIQGNTEAMEAFNKAEQEAIASAQKWAENKVLDITSKKQKSNESKVSIPSTADFKKYITNAGNTFSGGYADDFQDRISKTNNKLEECREIINKINNNQLDVITPEEISQLKEYIKYAKETERLGKKDKNKLVNENTYVKTMTNMKKYLADNSGMSKEFKNELHGLITELEQVGKSGSSADVKNIGNRFKEFTCRVAEAKQETKSFFDMFTSRVKGMSASALAQYFSLYDIIRYGKEAARMVTELDTAMVEFKKVTEGTTLDYAKFNEQIDESTKRVAGTHAALISSAADWARLGFSIQEASQLAENSQIFVNVGDGIDIDTATEDMISAMKAFNIEAEDSMQIVNSYNEVGNNFAISAGGIGEAMQRSASALAAGNNSFEDSIGLITAMNEVIQDTETTGTTLKVLSLRLRGAKTEIEDVGESTDGMADSTSKLVDKIKALTNVDGKGGFSILTESGDFKSTREMIEGIAQAYGSMSDVNQAALLELIAGKTRANGVAALLNNWEQIGKASEAALNSEDSALKENEQVINSIAGKTQVFKASLESLATTAVNSDFLKVLVDSGTTLISLLDKLIDKFGILTPLIVGGGAFAGFKNVGRLKKLSLKIV